ncbi:fibronectin type III domain-containing protein [Novosphingobium sp.]|uniref:fibronectin type III domain-containing protein n=1 Tax=Novosphingobium sp. TaxID=1874826 RepID=UPI0038B978FB
MGRRLSGNGGGGGAPAARTTTIPASAGPVFTITRLLGSSSTLSLIAGTNANLTLSGAAIVAAAAIAAGSSQVAVVREQLGQIATEYPVTLTGAPTVPGTPGVTLTAGNGQVSVAWTAPASNGGSPITAYKLYRSIAGGAETLLATITTASPYVDSGRTNGVSHAYRLSAVNAIGEGAKSASQSVTPSAAPSRFDATTATFDRTNFTFDKAA